jgi:hypothetical protein
MAGAALRAGEAGADILTVEIDPGRIRIGLDRKLNDDCFR